MNSVLKGMLIVLLIAYVISPADLMVGPVDDIIVCLLGARCMGRPSNQDYDVIED